MNLFMNLFESYNQVRIPRFWNYKEDNLNAAYTEYVRYVHR